MKTRLSHFALFLFVIAFTAASAQASIVLVYDSLLPGSGGSASQLSEISSQTDSNFVASANSFSFVGSGVTGGLLNGNDAQANTVTFGDQRDLQFRFGSAPEVALPNLDVAGSLASGNYIEFGFTAAQNLILDEFVFDSQSNSQNGANHSARDSGLFVDINGGGFTQFGSTVNRTGNGVLSNVTFTDSVVANSGDVITYRLAFADKTLTTTNFQAATRIGSVEISATAVPEPSSMVLLGLGVMGLTARRRSLSR